jgi:sugar fermentation stimulation protein A
LVTEKNKNSRLQILRVEHPLQCKIIERLNRFVVNVQVKGKPSRAHINNTGRLLEFLAKGKKGFCIRAPKKGKTDYRLFAVEVRNLGALIDTQFQMKALEKLVEMNFIPWLQGCRIQRRNPRLGMPILDYLLECSGQATYLEVKSAVLRDEDYALYPDCPSLRGQRHIRELSLHVKKGGRGTLLFMAALPQIKRFKPNKSADHKLCLLLRKAHASGVKVKSIALYYHPENSFIYTYNTDLEVDLL